MPFSYKDVRNSMKRVQDAAHNVDKGIEREVNDRYKAAAEQKAKESAPVK